jgi:hypothetical protein
MPKKILLRDECKEISLVYAHIFRCFLPVRQSFELCYNRCNGGFQIDIEFGDFTDPC